MTRSFTFWFDTNVLPIRCWLASASCFASPTSKMDLYKVVCYALHLRVIQIYIPASLVSNYEIIIAEFAYVLEHISIALLQFCLSVIGTEANPTLTVILFHLNTGI